MLLSRKMRAGTHGHVLEQATIARILAASVPECQGDRMTDPEQVETWGWAIFAGYCAVGLPIAWLHVKREDIKSEDAGDNRTFNWVILFLAIMWPILLLSMAANWLGKKMDGPKPKK